MTAEERRHAADLDQYLDGLVLAQRQPGTEQIDDETTDLIDRLWALSDPPDPGLARERVRRRLQQHPAWEERNMAAEVWVRAASEPSYGLASRGGASAAQLLLRSSQTGWRSVMGLMATAALLVLALAGSFFASGPGRADHESLAPVVMPAIGSPPTALKTSDVATTLLLDLVIPTAGGDRAWAQIERYVVSPATTMHADVRSSRVPEVFFVTDGAFTARVLDAPQPVRVIRAGGADAEETPTSGETVTLAAGDTIMVPENGAVDLMNMTAEPAIALLLLMPTDVPPPVNTGITFDTLASGIFQVSAPLALTLEQATVDPGASLPGVNAPNVERAVAPLDPDRVMDARIGRNGSLHNAGDEPLETYVLTVTSDAALP